MAESNSSTAQVVERHNRAMGQRDLTAVMADYAGEAVLIDPSGVHRGQQAIRGLLQGLLNSGLPLEPPSQQTIEGDIAYLVWAPPPGRPGRQGAETLVIRGGRIVAQTVAALGPPPPHR